jgi:hypothetical protein
MPTLCINSHFKLMKVAEPAGSVENVAYVLTKDECSKAKPMCSSSSLASVCACGVFPCVCVLERGKRV